MNEDADDLANMTLGELLETDIYPHADAELIRFAEKWYRHAGEREAAITARFGVTPTRFYQVVNTILDSPRRIADLPSELGPAVNRQRRLRDQRAAQRSARGLRTV